MEKRGNEHWKRRWQTWRKRQRKAAAVRAEKIRTLGIIRYSRQAVTVALREWRIRLRTSQGYRRQVKVALFGFIMGLGLVMWQAGVFPVGNSYRLFARTDDGADQNISAQGGSLLGPALDRLAAYGAEHLGAYNLAEAYNLADLNAVSTASGQQDTGGEAARLEAAFANLPVVVDFSEMVWPITGEVVQAFGWYRDTATQEWQFHSRLRIQAGRDYASVRASLAGVVESVDVTGSGFSVLIRHSQGWTSLYSGLSDVSVKTGSIVAAGDAIGETGTEAENQSHLWFGLYQDGEAVDPQDYLYSPS